MDRRKALVKKVEREYDNSGAKLALSREELKCYFHLNDGDTDYVIKELEENDKFSITEEYDETQKQPIQRLKISSRFAQNYWLFNVIVKEEAEVLIEFFGKSFNYSPNAKLIPIITENNRVIKLDLRNQFLKKIPEKIGVFSHLRELNLSRNQLTSLPFSIGNLTDLEILDLDNNKLKLLPDSIGNLKSLKELVLSDNQLEALPMSIQNLNQLENVRLALNEFKSKEEWAQLLGHVPQVAWGQQLPDIRAAAKKNTFPIIINFENEITKWAVIDAFSGIEPNYTKWGSFLDDRLGSGVQVKRFNIKNHEVTVILVPITGGYLGCLGSSPPRIRSLIGQPKIALFFFHKNNIQETSWIPEAVKEFQKASKRLPALAIIGIKLGKETISTDQAESMAIELDSRYYETKLDDFQRLDDIVKELVRDIFDSN